jgi:hypothetical protein
MASRNNSTAAQLTVETVSAPGSFLEFLGLDERDISWRQACRWRANRILHFTDRQNKAREWISFSELAERYSRNIGNDEGYEQLKRAVIGGEFERNGRSRILYLHPAVTRAKMTREWMRNVVETFSADSPETVRHYLACCWISRDLADAWCRSHNIGPSSTRHVSKKHGGRTPIDDSAALAKMRELTESGESERGAAAIAAAACGSPGASLEAKIDRLRTKFARGAAK